VFVANVKTVIVKSLQKKMEASGPRHQLLFVEKIQYMEDTYSIILVTVKDITVRDKRDAQFQKFA
jgi:hypothetical protein